MTVINKMTMNDLWGQLDNKLGSSEYGYASVYDLDTDKSIVYVSVWSDGGREYYSYSYSLNGPKVEIDDASRKEVIKTTVYEDKPEEAVTMSKLKSFFKSMFRQTQIVDKSSLPLFKQFEDEKMVSLEFLYIKPDTFDAHNHTISREDTELMVKSFMDNIKTIKPSFAHKHETDKFSIIKAWVNPHDCTIGETFVPEGQPICELQWKTAKVWEARKSGLLAGVSIGCKAELEDIEDEA